MAEKCPLKTSKEWKLLVSQLDEDRAWYTWLAWGEDYPPNMKVTSAIKAELGMKNNMSNAQIKALGRRVRIYNDNNHTSHTFTTTQVGQADLYMPTLRVNYLPKDAEILRQKAISDKTNNVDFAAPGTMGISQGKQMDLWKDEGYLKSFLQDVMEKFKDETDAEFAERKNKYVAAYQRYVYSDKIPIDVQLSVANHITGVMLELITPQLSGKQKVSLYERDPVTGKAYLQIKGILQSSLKALEEKALLNDDEQAEKDLLEKILDDKVYAAFEEGIIRKLQSKKYKFVKGEILTKEDGAEQQGEESDQEAAKDIIEPEETHEKTDPQRNSLTIPNKETMSTAIRTFLSSIRSNQPSLLTLSIDRGVLDGVQVPKQVYNFNYVNEDTVIGAINAAVVGDTTLDEMIRDLRQTAAVLPDRAYLAAVADKLQDASPDIRHQFVSKFNQQQAVFIVHRFDKKQNILGKFENEEGAEQPILAISEDGKTIYEYQSKMIDANRQGAAANMRVKAKEDFFAEHAMTSDVVSDEVKVDIYAAYLAFKESASSYLVIADGKQKQYKDIDGLITALDELLRLVNINLSQDALRRFLTGSLDKPVTFDSATNYSSVFNPTYGKLAYIFSQFGDKESSLDINAIHDNGGARALFDIEALYQELYYNTSVVNGKNNRVWAYSAPNPLSAEFYAIQKELESNVYSHINDINADPFRSKSALLSAFSVLSKEARARFIENFKYSIVNTLRAGHREGKDLSDTYAREFILTQIIAMTSNTADDGLGNTWSFKFLTTPSEKPTMYQVQTPDYKIEFTKKKGTDITKTAVGDRTINSFYRYFTAEYGRFMQYQNATAEEKATIDSLSNSEPRLFYWFPGLNLNGPENPLWKDGKLVEIADLFDKEDPIVAYIRDEIRNQVQADIDATREAWKDLGLMTKTGNMVMGFPQSYRKKVNSEVSLVKQIAALKKNPDKKDGDSFKEDIQNLYKQSHTNLSEYLLYEYAINYQLHNMEMQILFLGSPTDFLKNEGKKMDNKLFESNDIGEYRKYIEAIRTNLVKRMAGIQASGNVGAIDPHAPTANYVVMEDLPVMSKAIEEYRKFLDPPKVQEDDEEEEEEEKESSKFEKIDHLDGQEIVTAEEDLRMRFYSSGKLTQAKYDAMLKKVKGAHEDIRKLGYITDENLFDDDEKFTAQAAKPVMFALVPVHIGKSVKFKATYFKPSAFGLYPQLTVNLEIDKLRSALYELSLKGLRVDRLPALSAAKLGAKAPIKGLFSQDSNGKVIINKDVLLSVTDANIDEVPRENLRIQLEVPYDEEKESISMASQATILIFNEILDVTFNGRSVSNFLPEFKGRDVTGQELKDLHEETFKKLLDISKAEFLKKIGAKPSPNGGYTFDNLVKLRAVLYDQALKQGYDMPSLEGLELTSDKKAFLIPLSFSSNADRFEKLLLALVKKAVLQKMHGRSLILSSEAGFVPHHENRLPAAEEKKVLEGAEAEEYIKRNETSITFVEYDKETDTGYNPEIGLQPARPNPNNPEEILPHQVLVSFKYKDKEGKLLNINEFITTDAKGRKILNTKKMSPEILRVLGIRIPVQGHPSIGSIEIVGFLPYFAADQVIAPMDFTKIFGSDFDIDKLYGYMYNYTYSKESGLRRYSPPPKKEISQFDLFEEGPVIGDDLDEEEDSPDKKMLQNKLQDIYHAIARNTEVWKKAVIGINEGRLTEIANRIKKHKMGVSPRYFSPASEQLKVKEYFENKDGQTGVSIYSAMNTFATIIENKGLRLAKLEKDDKGRLQKVTNDIKIVPNGGFPPVSFSVLSGAKGFNRIISAWQSASVDSVKLDILSWINTNEVTMGVSGVMAMLADDSKTHEAEGTNLPLLNEDFIVYFLSQPAIIDYVKALSKGNDAISGKYVANFEAVELDAQIKKAEAALAKLIGEDTDGAILDFPGFNLEILKKNFYTPNSSDLEYVLYQYATLLKFKEFVANARDVRSLQSLLNANSKGTSKSIDEAMYKSRKLDRILEEDDYGQVRGLPSLLNVESIFEEGGVETLAGKMARMGIELPIELFAENNIFTSGSKSTESAIQRLSLITNKDADKYSYKFGRLINGALLSYMQARNSFKVQDPGSTITADKQMLLFGNDDENSLGTDLDIFKASKEYEDSPILKPLMESIKIRTIDGAKFIEFQAFTGLINPTEEIIQSLEHLRRLDSVLFDKLVRYVLLMQFHSSAISLKPFIAPFYIHGIGLASRYRDTVQDLGKEDGYIYGTDANGKIVLKSAYGEGVVTYFEEQFLQHFPEEAVQVDADDIKLTKRAGIISKFSIDITKNTQYQYIGGEIDDKSVISKFAIPYLSLYDNKEDRFHLYKITDKEDSSDKTRFVYEEIPTLGAYNLDEFDYDATTTKHSLLAKNNPIPIAVVEKKKAISEDSRFTPEKLTKETMPANGIFVFGSNDRGVHGAGAALDAVKEFGAVKGQPSGKQGKSFAVRTKMYQDGKLTVYDKLTPDNKKEMDKMTIEDLNALRLEAVANPGNTYYVTEIGTKLAGRSVSQMKDLFSRMNNKFGIPSNIILPRVFEVRGVTTNTIDKDGNVRVVKTKYKDGKEVESAWKALGDYETGDALVAMRNSAKPDAHWGNPFSNKLKTTTKVFDVGTTVAERVQAFRDWLSPSNPYPDVEPKRREWILKEIASGKWKGATILYYDELNEPSHANALDELINEEKEAPNTPPAGIQEVKVFKWNKPNAERGTDADVAMRKVATGAIVEFKTDKTPSSSFTTLGEVGKKNAYSYEGDRYIGTSYEDIVEFKTFFGPVVMLARNGKLKGTGLAEDTQMEINNAFNQGATFVVGDMEGVDTPFIDYLNEIGAKYSIYGHGRLKGISDVPFNRVAANKPPIVVSQIKPFADNATGALGMTLAKYFKTSLNAPGVEIVTNILETIASERNRDNPYFKELAQLLLDVNSQTGFLTNIKFVTSSAKEGGDFYNSGTHTVSVSTAHKEDELPYVILHELIHAASVSNFTGEAGMQLRLRIERVIAALETDEAIQSAISYHGLDGASGTNTKGQVVKIDIAYIRERLAALRAGKMSSYSSEAERKIIGPLIDFKEFVAMSLGDAKVQRFMATMDYQDYAGAKTTSILERLKTVFNLFFTKLANLLGIKIKKETVLYSAINLALEALSTLKQERETGKEADAKKAAEKSFDPNDKILRPGSVVKYAGARYIYWNTNLSGKAQLIKEDGTKFVGTPNPDKLEVLGGFKTVIYNSKEYIVTDNEHVFSAATGKLVYEGLDDSSKAQKKKILDQAFDRRDISHLVGISPTPGVANTPQDTNIPEKLSMNYYKVQLWGFHREAETVRANFKAGRITQAQRDAKIQEISNKITRINIVIDRTEDVGFKLSQFYTDSISELAEMERLVNSGKPLSIEEYMQVATTFEYFTFMGTTLNSAYIQTIVKKGQRPLEYVETGLKDKILEFQARAASLRKTLVDASLKAFIGEYNHKYGTTVKEEEALNVGNSSSVALWTTELAIQNNALASVIGRLLSEVVSETNSSLESHKVTDEAAISKFLQYYKFEDILQTETYLDQHSTTKTDKNFIGRYNGEYFRERDRIFQDAFKRTGPGQSGKAISAGLKRIAHSIDIRYLFPDEYNKEMQFYLGTSNDKVELTSNASYRKYLLDYYLDQYKGYDPTYVEERMEEVIQYAVEKFDEYTFAKDAEEIRIAGLAISASEQKMDMLDWISENSPFVLLNERFGLEKTKGALLDAPMFVGAKYSRATTKVNAAGVSKTAHWFVNHSARKDKAERYVIKKANRFYEDGSVTGFINDKFLDMEQAHFKKLRDKKAFIAAGNQAAADALDTVPSLYEFWKWTSDRQRYYLSTIPYYLRSDMSFTSMVDVQQTDLEKYEDKKIKALKLFDISHLTFDIAMESLKNFWLLPDLLKLAWNKTAQLWSERKEAEDSELIDFLRTSARMDFNPAGLDNSLNNLGLGMLKTNNMRSYFNSVRSLSVTFRVKNEAESLIRLGEFLYVKVDQLDDKGRTKAKREERDSLEWSIDRQLYGKKRKEKGTVLNDSSTKLFGVFDSVWKLTSDERKKYVALELRIEELEARYALNLSTKEKLLLDREIEYLTKARDRIARVVTPSTLVNSLILQPMRQVYLGFAPTGRVFDWTNSSLYGVFREGADGRIFKSEHALKALTHVSNILMPKATTSLVAVGATAFGNFPLAAGALGARIAAGVYNQTYRRPEYLKLMLFARMVGALDQSHVTSDDLSIEPLTVPTDIKGELLSVSDLLLPMTLVKEVEISNKVLPHLATWYATEIKDLSGNTRNLYEAFIVNSNDELVWNEAEFGLRSSRGYDITGTNFIKVKARGRVAYKHMSGNYNAEDILLMDSNLAGVMAQSLQRYIFQWFNARWGGISEGKAYIDRNVDIEYMGSTYAAFKTIKSRVLTGQWETDPAIVAAVRQAKFGAAWITGAFVLGTLLVAGRDDDDDEWYDTLAFAANFILMKNFIENIAHLDVRSAARKSATGAIAPIRFGLDILDFGSAAWKSTMEGDLMSHQELTANGLSEVIVPQVKKYKDPRTGKWKKTKGRREYPDVSRTQYHGSKLIPYFRQMRNLPKFTKPMKKGNASYEVRDFIYGDN